MIYAVLLFLLSYTSAQIIEDLFGLEPPGFDGLFGDDDWKKFDPNDPDPFNIRKPLNTNIAYADK